MRELIEEQLRVAEASKDKTRISLLRLIKIAIEDRDNAAREDGEARGVSDEEIRRTIRSMIKQREECAVNFEELGQLELADAKREELNILGGLLPQPLSREEIEKAVERAIKDTRSSSIRHKGRVIDELKRRHNGRIDIRRVHEIVGRQLSKLPDHGHLVQSPHGYI